MSASPTDPRAREPLGLRQVAAHWAPLAGSWLLMGLELPAVSAVIARLPQPTVCLAAYGGVVLPTALIIESPIIMLLAASTALARDEASFRLISRFMRRTAGALTALHALVAFTPLFDVLAGGVLGMPEPVRGPARIGLQIMLPWTFSIAYRRTQQGLLIRFGRPHAVTIGTAVRLAANGLVLAAGLLSGRVGGMVVGAAALVCGVVAESLYAGWAARPVRRGPLREAPVVAPALTLPAFLRFYLPLMLTPLLNFLALPLAAAAMSRMPRAIDSLAVWPALSGLAFTLRSTGFALNEVVVAQLDACRPLPALRRFTLLLSIVTSGLLALVAFTPLAGVWFGGVSGLPPPLASLAAGALALLVLTPATSAWQSWYQGALVHSRRTRGVTESMVALLLVTALALGLGIAWQGPAGVWFAALGLLAGNLAQTAWLAVRARPAIAAVRERDRRAGAAA